MSFRESLADLCSEISLIASSKRVVFCDDGITEFVKWSRMEESSSRSCLVLPFKNEMETYENDLIRIFCPDQLVFMITSPLRDVQSSICQTVAVCSENIPHVDMNVLILTSTFEESMASTDSGSKNNVGYGEIIQQLKPCESVVFYLPLHSFAFIPPAQPISSEIRPSLDAFVLTSPPCRDFFNVSLSGLGLWRHKEDKKEQPSLHSIDVNDIPSATRSRMRVLVHELAGALVFGYSLDCSSHVFTLGKTADFIGHTIQPAIERLVALRDEALNTGTFGSVKRIHKQNMNVGAIRAAMHLSDGTPTEVLRQLYGQQPQNPNGDSLIAQRASLLIIDRASDMLTPGVQTSAAPLAHRIINTLQRHRVKLQQSSAHSGKGVSTGIETPKSYSLCDLNPQQLQGSLMEGFVPSLVDATSAYAISACTSSKGEEQGITELCSSLNSLAKIQGKEGTGVSGNSIEAAEATLRSVIHNATNNSTPSFSLYGLQSSTLLGHAVSAVAAFKQAGEFNVISSVSDVAFQVSYEVRRAREHALLQILSVPNSGLAESIPFVLSFFSNSSSLSNKKCVRDPCIGQSCVLHTLFLLLMTVSLVGCGSKDESEHLRNDYAAAAASLSLVSDAIVDRIVYLQDVSSVGTHNRTGELEALKRCGFDFVQSNSLSEITRAVEAIMGRILEHALDNDVKAVLEADSDVQSKFSGTFARVARSQLRAEYIGTGGGRAIARTLSSSSVTTKDINIIGLLALLVGSILEKACDADGLVGWHAASCRRITLPLQMLMHVQSPLEKLKQAGLGLLNKGLSLWGSSDSIVQGVGRSINSDGQAHPADYETLVVFVIGGISYRELSQIQEQLELYYSNHDEDERYETKRMRVIVGSSRTYSSVNMLDMFLY